MSLSRVQFLKSLGGSVAGYATGLGVATAAQTLLAKIARESGEDIPAPVLPPAVPPAIPFFTQGPGSGRRIALTFDDGPTPGVTNLVLDELKKRNLRATFFMIGRQVAAAPELAQRVFAEGHEIGNHTFHHLKLTALPDAQVDAEIQQTQDVIGELLQHRPAWLRPPFGALRQDQARLAAGKQLGVALWNVDSRDWAQPGAEKIAETISSAVQPGSIILCHDLYRQTADGLGQVLDRLLAQNFEFLGISDLLAGSLVQTT